MSLSPEHQLTGQLQDEDWFYCIQCSNYRRGFCLLFQHKIFLRPDLSYTSTVTVCAQCGMRHLAAYPESSQRYVKSNSDLLIFAAPNQGARL
jgi:hypothetical protein